MKGEGHAISALDSHNLVLVSSGDDRISASCGESRCADENAGEFARRFGLVKTFDLQVRLKGVGLVSVGVSVYRGVDERLTTILWVGKKDCAGTSRQHRALRVIPKPREESK